MINYVIRHLRAEHNFHIDDDSVIRLFNELPKRGIVQDNKVVSYMVLSGDEVRTITVEALQKAVQTFCDPIEVQMKSLVMKIYGEKTPENRPTIIFFGPVWSSQHMKDHATTMLKRLSSASGFESLEPKFFA